MRKRISKPLKYFLLLLGIAWSCLFAPGCSSPANAASQVPESGAPGPETPTANGYTAPTVNVDVDRKHYPPAVTQTVCLEAYANSLEQQAKVLAEQGLPGVAETKQAVRSLRAAYQCNFNRLTAEEKKLYDDYQRHRR
jgi:hypothetical protein